MQVVKVDNDLIGTKVELRRRQSPSLYGGDFENVVFQVTQYTDDMMRFSVFKVLAGVFAYWRFYGFFLFLVLQCVEEYRRESTSCTVEYSQAERYSTKVWNQVQPNGRKSFWIPNCS